MRYPPTPHYQPSSYEPGQNEQEVADTTIDDDDQEEYDANTALQFPGIRNLHDEGQPILYRTMQRYLEREAQFFQGFTADDIADVERHFADAKVRIQFSINPSLQPPNDQLNIINYRREIEDVCQERFGLTFRGGLLEHGQQLLGDPLQRTIQAWAAPRRGYLFLRDISVVMIYQYAGVLDNGLSFHQLECRNPSKTSPGDLMCALRALGATDAIVQSHTRMSRTHGPRDHWAAIGCINWPSEGHYRFRLVFPSQSMAETVYANFRQHMAGPDRLDLVPPSMKLTPLRDLCWDNPISTFFHPHATSAATLVDTKVRIGRLPPLTTTDDILAALRGSHLPTPDVDITGDGYATLTFDTPAPIAFLWSTSGPHGETRLYIRDIAVHLHILTGRPRRSTAPLHRHRHAGHHSHSALQHPAAEGQHQQHQPQTQAWQLPLQRHPQQVHGHTTDLNLYLRRELSTYVDQRIVSATTPLRQEVESLRADKEALAALVSASSAAFSTLDARLLEERRLREAAELLQAKDNRLSAEAHIRLNTVVTQHESQQAALTARLPYLESSVHTLLQAMQSVSHLHDPYSSDDSNNSELLDARIAEALQTPLPLSTPDINPPRQRRRRRAWRIHRLPLPPPDADTARHQLDNILRRESLKGEAYIGDPGQPPPPGLLLDSLRIAAININKNTYGKLGDELATWFRANALDFLIIADSDLPAHKATHLWTSTPSGSPTPHLMAVSNHRVSVLYDIQRWHSRIDARRTTYSPSGCSISICIRLGKGSLLTLIGTYCQDSPASHRETTEQEWQWLTQATTKIPGHHHSVIMGGYFNTYGTNPLDRSAPQPRAGPSLDIGTAFQRWIQSIGLLSTFRYRHPNRQRYTYARNNTAVTLDDIYISAQSAHKLSASGIWLHTIHSSDHAGTPFLALALCPGDHTPSRLSGVQPIRVVNTRYLTKGDISTFGEHTSQLLLEGRLPPLITAPPHMQPRRGPRKKLPTGLKGLIPPTGPHGGMAQMNPQSKPSPTNMLAPLRSYSTGLRQLQDNWIPPAEKTARPRHLDTGLHSDRLQVPHYVRDWLLHDMDRPDVVAQAFQSPTGTTWDTYHYDEDMQARCDRSLRTRVSPGHEGVSQELWIAAPACIRERERTIINLILRTGLVPPILGRKQMIYLAKSATAHGVVNLDPGLPPWRPITVQSALSSRIFTVIRDYISPCIPNEELQHGFQRDRTVQDAAVLTSLLIERAERRQEELFLISKDCLKCFDRIPGWVMEYIYRKLGVPSLPRQLMAHFLGASQIDIRTAFGWLDGGIREFGLGQGSILAVMHIGYYMDVLIRQHQGGTDPVQISHSQHPQGPRTRTISSLLFVDDALDISTSYSGIQDRVRISNQLTGQSASGGVFGADKSFLFYLSPHAYPTVALNDGLGNPQPIRVVAPSEGFRHLGIHQGTHNQWEETTRTVWLKLNTQAAAIAPRGLGKKELQYIINAVWIPSVLYRTAISDAISITPALDILFRKTARRVLRLPHDHPNSWFYDHTDGLGLVHCERFSHSQRLYQFLRIANDCGSPAHDCGSPAHDILMESLESYQTESGLTDHPLAFR
ncbi:hypothetical protein DYB37_008079, partial [Aphanomyces astaci]